MHSVSQLPTATDGLRVSSGSRDHLERLTQVCVDDLISAFGLDKASYGRRNPLIHLRRRRREREWLAATLQLLIPALRDVDSRVEFGRPIHAEPYAAVGDAAADGDPGVA